MIIASIFLSFSLRNPEDDDLQSDGKDHNCLCFQLPSEMIGVPVLGVNPEGIYVPLYFLCFFRLRALLLMVGLQKWLFWWTNEHFLFLGPWNKTKPLSLCLCYFTSLSWSSLQKNPQLLKLLHFRRFLDYLNDENATGVDYEPNDWVVEIPRAFASVEYTRTFITLSFYALFVLLIIKQLIVTAPFPTHHHDIINVKY